MADLPQGSLKRYTQHAWTCLLGTALVTGGVVLAACASTPAASARATNCCPQPNEPVGKPTTRAPAISETPAGATAGAAPPAPVTPAAAQPPKEALRLRPLVPTAFASQLAELGFDAGRLPPLSEVSLGVKSDLMALMSRSLGVECTVCHASETDFRAETRNKAITRKMWSEFVVGRALKEGPVFCDSCHQGQAQVLQRERRADVKAYMKTEYARLIDSAGHAAGCEDCHGRPLQPQIFAQLWAVPPLSQDAASAGVSETPNSANSGGPGATAGTP